MNVEALNSGVRKKIRKDRSTYRKKTYTDKDPLCVNFQPSCRHGKNTKFKCSSISMDDVIKNRNRLYDKTRKVDQDIFLARLLGPSEPKRRGNSEPRSTTRNRTNSGSYYVLKFRGKKMQKVCRSFFMKVFSVSRKRLQNLNKVLMQGEIPKEKRGGDRKSKKTKAKKDSLRNFLNKLPASESHYNRQKSKRIYLSSELNAKKLRQYYNDSVTDADLRVSRTMFYEIFHKEFNISFKTPAFDVCGTCILWKNKIKIERDPQKKQQLMVEKRIHTLRANTFYAMIREDVPDSISFCFDMEKVQPLPKTPMQDAYYSRQISLYNLCVVALDSKTPTFFTWLETQSGRGSVEVGSALYTYLNELEIPANIKTLRLFCDGCGGQNKNSHIVHMLIYWLLNKSPPNLKEIRLTFPVRGHSFLPADRVFGRLEKDIKRATVMTLPEAYYEIYRKHGTMKVLGEDWSLYNIKDLEQNYKKVADIQSVKRIIIKKSQRSGCNIYTHETFRFETVSKPINLLKRGKRHCQTVEQLPMRPQGIDSKKKKDVNNLLVKQFGDGWAELPELLFFRNIILDEQTTITGNNNEDRNEDHQHDEACDCLEHDIGQIRI